MEILDVCVYRCYSLADYKIFHSSKIKGLGNENENMIGVGKGENAGYQYFLIFLQRFRRYLQRLVYFKVTRKQNPLL